MSSPIFFGMTNSIMGVETIRAPSTSSEKFIPGLINALSRIFPDPTVADAILDRVVHQAHRIALKGESMRKLQARHKMRME